MNYYIIAGALLVAALLTFIFSKAFRGKGPFGGLFLFFLVLFFTTWAGQLWIMPFGPVTLGIIWVPLIAVALMFAVLMVALARPSLPMTEEKIPGTANEQNASVLAIGIFFWCLLVLLIAAIIVGYYRIM